MVHQDLQVTKDNRVKLEKRALLDQKEEQVNKEALVLLVPKETR